VPAPCSQACTAALDTAGRSRGKPAGTGAPQPVAPASRTPGSQTVTLVLDATITASVILFAIAAHAGGIRRLQFLAESEDVSHCLGGASMSGP
jgi:hypothetical protein